MLHYIITRFNLRLWTHDKRGKAIDREQWMERRLELFERYCLPSLCRQTCRNFTWFLLFDKQTPEKYKQRVTGYKRLCPQIQLIGMQPTSAVAFIGTVQDFVKDFAKEHLKEHPEADRIITTYLDNDDALRQDFVEKVQLAAESVKPRTFISFSKGIQYFTELQIATQIPYKNNHFISFVEDIDGIHPIVTVYGFGSHFYIEQIPDCDIEYIDDAPMWVEVVHEENVDNDVKMTFRTKLITDQAYLAPYGNNIIISRKSMRVYLTRFLWRRFTQTIRRLKNKINGENW